MCWKLEEKQNKSLLLLSGVKHWSNNSDGSLNEKRNWWLWWFLQADKQESRYMNFLSTLLWAHPPLENNIPTEQGQFSSTPYKEFTSGLHSGAETCISWFTGLLTFRACSLKMALILHRPTILLLKASVTAENTQIKTLFSFLFPEGYPSKMLFTCCSVGESSAPARFQSGSRKSALEAPCANRNVTRSEADETSL